MSDITSLMEPTGESVFPLSARDLHLQSLSYYEVRGATSRCSALIICTFIHGQARGFLRRRISRIIQNLVTVEPHCFSLLRRLPTEVPYFWGAGCACQPKSPIFGAQVVSALRNKVQAGSVCRNGCASRKYSRI